MDTNRQRNLFTLVLVHLPAIRRLSLWLLPLAFLVVFFFAPLARIIGLTFSQAILTPENVRNALGVLWFTFYQAALSTLITLLLGLPAAVLFARYDFPGKTLLRALIAVPFLLPTVVVAAAFNALFGQNGWLNALVNIQMSSAPSLFVLILLAHTFYNTTIVIRMAGTALASLDPKLEQTARSLGADSFRVWTRLILPLLRPSILAAALLVFLFDFTSFGVILLLGRSQFATLEVEIYLQSVKFLNLPLAALLALIQLLFTLVFSVIYTRYAARLAPQLAPRSTLIRPQTLQQKLFIISFCLLLFAFFLLPLTSLPFRSVTRLEPDRGQRGKIQYGLTTDYYAELFVNRRNSIFYVPPVQAILNSVLFASATAILSLLIGFPAAFALAKPTALEKFLDPLVMLPLGASAVMLGLGFLLTFGKWLASPLLVPFAHTLVALPFVIRTLQPAIASIPQRLRQAASTLGASPMAVWQAIDLPILLRAMLSAATFAFTISLGEFGASLLITRPGYPTIPVAIERFLSQPGGINYGQAMAMATILMLVTVMSILLIEKFRLPESRDF